MDFIPLNFGILRVPTNWLIIALVTVFYIQATKILLPRNA